jgi:hypothetical protein
MNYTKALKEIVSAVRSIMDVRNMFPPESEMFRAADEIVTNIDKLKSNLDAENAKNTVTARELIDIEERGDWRIACQYSGRGMMGETCFGFVTSVGEMMSLGIAMEHVLGEDRAERLVECASTDSMGHDMIVYFRGWTCIDPLPSDEGDGDDV